MHHVIKSRGKKQSVAIMWESVIEPRKAAASITTESRRATALGFATGTRIGDSPDRWLGAPSYQVLRERLEKGWAEGVDRLMKLATRELSATSIRRRRVRGDQGDELDMQAVYRGDLSRAWTRTRRQSRTGVRTVNIVCNLGASASTDAEKLFWRGASALRLADALVQAGYNVGIYAAETGTNSGANKDVTVGQFIEIKAPDSPLDLSSLAAITCMPGFFRTDLFAGIVIGCDLAGDDVSPSMGSEACELVPELAEQIGLTGCIVQPKVNNKDAAEKWIEEAIQQIEQPLAEAA